jgi:hypothetical protein
MQVAHGYEKNCLRAPALQNEGLYPALAGEQHLTAYKSQPVGTLPFYQDRVACGNKTRLDRCESSYV